MGKRLNGRMLTCKKAKARTRNDNESKKPSPTRSPPSSPPSDDPCRDFSRWGSCMRGKSCRFKHVQGTKVPEPKKEDLKHENKSSFPGRPKMWKGRGFKPAHNFRDMPRPVSRSPSPRYHADGHEFATIKGYRYPIRSNSRSSSSEWCLVQVVH